MSTLTRIRHTPGGTFLVEVANLRNAQHFSTAVWQNGPEFDDEREAELFARAYVQSQPREKDEEYGFVDEGSQYTHYVTGRGSYWRWPRRCDRTPI